MAAGHDRVGGDDRQLLYVEQPSHVEQLWQVRQPGSTHQPPQAAGISASELQACLPGLGQRVYQGISSGRTKVRPRTCCRWRTTSTASCQQSRLRPGPTTGGEAALEAQAVAARSYALALVASSGVICDTTACQMYTGLPDQYGLTADNAVSSTAGQVLYCNAGSNMRAGRKRRVAEYSASTGGYTAGGAFPAVQDLGDSVPANPVHSWTVEVPVSTIESTLSSIGTLEQVDVTERNGLGQFGGRVEEVEVVGDEGSVSLSGDQFAADFGLRQRLVRDRRDVVYRPDDLDHHNRPLDHHDLASAPYRRRPRPAPGPDRSGAARPALGRDNGYWVVDSKGDVAAFGAAKSYGTAAGTSLQGIVRGMVATPDYKGYWMVGSNGGVLAFGDASWYGSASKLHLAKRVVGMAATPNGGGYWLVASDGGIFAFGDAGFYGSTGRLHLTNRLSVSQLRPTGAAIGWWRATAGSLPSATLGFTARSGNAASMTPSPASCRAQTGVGTSSWPRTGEFSPSAMRAFWDHCRAKASTPASSAVAPTYDNGGYYVLTTSGRVYTFGDATPAAQLEARWFSELAGEGGRHRVPPIALPGRPRPSARSATSWRHVP